MHLRPLIKLSVANLLLALLLFALHRHGSELTRLYSVLHINLLRDDSASFMQVACTTAAQGKPVYQDLFFASIRD